MTPHTYSTAEIIAREPARTLWRIVTWRGGQRMDQRDEWREPSKDDEA